MQKIKSANKNKRKINGECVLCKARFEISLSDMNLTPEEEERMREHFSHNCVVCMCLQICRENLNNNHKI